MMKNPIPMLDPKRDLPLLGDALTAAATDVIHSGQYVLGPQVEAFEGAMAKRLGVQHALGVSSGTDALLMALMALDVGPGDEVLLPSFTFFATAGVVWRLGATPIFVDSDKETFNIDLGHAETKVSPKTKALIAVHLYGQCCDFSALLRFKEKHGIALVEDAAQAIDSKDGELCAGAVGEVGCFSFYPTKNLGALGDAGLCTTQDTALYERLRRLRIHGAHQTYLHEEVGGNFRMDAFGGALLNVKLPELSAWTARRRSTASRYDEVLGNKSIQAPVVRDGIFHSYHQYTVLAPDEQSRDALREALGAKNISSGIYYPLPLHLQPCFSAFEGERGDCPVAESFSTRCLSLPIFHGLLDEEIERIIEVLATI